MDPDRPESQAAGAVSTEWVSTESVSLSADEACPRHSRLEEAQSRARLRRMVGSYDGPLRGAASNGTGSKKRTRFGDRACTHDEVSPGAPQRRGFRSPRLERMTSRVCSSGRRGSLSASARSCVMLAAARNEWQP